MRRPSHELDHCLDCGKHFSSLRRARCPKCKSRRTTATIGGNTYGSYVKLETLCISSQDVRRLAEMLAYSAGKTAEKVFKVRRCVPVDDLRILVKVPRPSYAGGATVGYKFHAVPAQTTGSIYQRNQRWMARDHKRELERLTDPTEPLDWGPIRAEVDGRGSALRDFRTRCQKAAYRQIAAAVLSEQQGLRA